MKDRLTDQTRRTITVVARAIMPLRITSMLTRGTDVPKDMARIILSVATRSPLDTLGIPGEGGRKRCRHCEVIAVMDNNPLMHADDCVFLDAVRIARDLIPEHEVTLHRALEAMLRL